MLPRNHPDRIRVSFDDHRLVANAGLLLPATLAHHLGLRELVDHHLDLGVAPGRANTGDKMLTLVASALAGGDCIDDADALRAGGTARILGGTIKAPSTLGTFLRSFRWGHVRQLDRVSRELLARAWQAGAGPGDSPLTIPGLNHLRDLRTWKEGAATTGNWVVIRLVGNGGAGALRRGSGPGFYTQADKRALLHHHPPAQKPAEPDRGHTADWTPTILDGRRCGRVSEPDAAPVRRSTLLQLS